jgi:hypothetical protein
VLVRQEASIEADVVRQVRMPMENAAAAPPAISEKIATAIMISERVNPLFFVLRQLDRQDADVTSDLFS